MHTKIIFTPTPNELRFFTKYVRSENDNKPKLNTNERNNFKIKKSLNNKLVMVWG